MKGVNAILGMFLMIATGCGGNRKSTIQEDVVSTVVTQDTFITVDVSKEYPRKELILQDIMDVEYIALESTDEFLCQGDIQAIGKEIILVKNVVNDGDIFIFDRNGKGLRKFNRKGQGPEEYILNLSIFLDEGKGEIYIDEVIRNVLVYDLHGNFLRTIYRGENRWINATNYTPDYSLTLFMTRTPSIQSMKPAIFLLPCLFTERYYFMEKVIMKADFSKNEGFPKTRLAYDRTENVVFEYTVLNDDFIKKGSVDFTVQGITNREIAILIV